MNSYKEELEYRFELLETLSGQMEAVQLAEELIEYGKLESSGVLVDPGARLEVIRYLASDIEGDKWRLQRFRLAYFLKVMSLSDSERPLVANAVRELCAKELPFLRKSLGFKLSEIQAIVARLEKNKKNRD
jgi:hypothetical protein